MTGEAELDEPFAVEVLRHLLQNLDPPQIIFNQVVIGRENGGDFAFIESIIEVYCNLKKPDTDMAGFRRDMKLLAMGTCLSIQFASVLIGNDMQVKDGTKGMIPGASFNLLLTGAFLKITVQEESGWDYFLVVSKAGLNA